MTQGPLATWRVTVSQEVHAKERLTPHQGPTRNTFQTHQVDYTLCKTGNLALNENTTDSQTCGDTTKHHCQWSRRGLWDFTTDSSLPFCLLHCEHSLDEFWLLAHSVPCVKGRRQGCLISGFTNRGEHVTLGMISTELWKCICLPSTLFTIKCHQVFF